MTNLGRLQLAVVLSQLSQDTGSHVDALLVDWERRVEVLVAAGKPLADAESMAYHAMVKAATSRAAHRARVQQRPGA